MSKPEVSLFGGFTLRYCDQAIEVPAPKDRGLLAVLATAHGSPQSRVKLANLLWGESGDRAARDSLKQAVLRLRRQVGNVCPDALMADRNAIALDCSLVDVDVVQFEKMVAAGTIATLDRAIDLYRGEFLEGLSARSPAFDDWLLMERQRLHQMAVDACVAVMTKARTAGQLDRAAAVARRLLALDPLHEGACRMLMQIHADRAERIQALKLYEAFAARLQRELGVSPERVTVQLYHELHSRSAAIGEPPPSRTIADAGSRPSRLSIAILPFEDLSADHDQQYFGDGITEDVIAALSRFRSLMVTAKNSAFQFRGKGRAVQDVARELSVQYIVQGSVRRSGERIRVSVHLVDAANGNHLWAERYDRQLADVFAMQDEVSGAIAATIEGRISAGAAARARRMPTEHMAAYDFVLQAREHMARYDMSAAEPLLNKALSIDPSYAEAHARRAFVVMYRYWSNQDNALLVEARRHAEHALEADEAEEWAHFAMANVHLSLREFDIAEKHFERGMSINPNNVTGRIMYAEWLNYVGRFDDALEHLAEVVLRDPFPPDWYWEIRGTALFQLRRYDEAVRSFRRISAVQPWNSVYLAAALAHAGHFAEAAKQVTMQRMGTPAVSLMKLAARDPYKETEPTEHLLAGLRKAQRAAEAARQ